MIQEKICLNCGNTFEPKRSDAKFCSTKCKSAYTYDKKKKDKAPNDVLIQKEALNSSNNHEPIIKGEVHVQKIIDLIARTDEKIEKTAQVIEKKEKEEAEMLVQIKRLEDQVIEIKQTKLLVISKRLNQSDFMLYNNFLNRKYIEKKKTDNAFAKNEILSTEDLKRSYNDKIRLEIANYRHNLQYQLEEVNYEIELLVNQMALLKTELEKLQLTLKENRDNLRFYQSRILKYESLLSA